GMVDASFATSRSPAWRQAGSRWRCTCRIVPSASTTSSLASGGRCVGLPAACMLRCPFLNPGFHVVDDFAGRATRLLECASVCIRNGERMQGRIHVAGIDRLKSNAVWLELLVPDPTQVEEGGLARTVRAPTRICGHRGVADHVDYQRRAA